MSLKIVPVGLVLSRIHDSNKDSNGLGVALTKALTLHLKPLAVT